MKPFFWRRRKNLLPLISIIMPTYNAAKTLSRSIESVISQNYQAIELILIDGFSQDATPSIIREAAKTDSRIRYISEKDRGAYEAMNKGISMSKGDWAYFLGSDDVLINEFILQDLHDTGYFSQKKLFYGNVIIEGATSWANDQEVYAGEFDLPKLLKKNICHQAIFYPRHLIKKAGFYNTDYVVCADWDFNLRCYAMESFLYVDKIIARFSGGGLSTVHKEELFLKEFPNKIISYFKLDPDDPKLAEPDSPFGSIILSYRKLMAQDQKSSS